MVSYNYLDSTAERPIWSIGTLDRTAWSDSAIFGKPHATDYDDSSNVSSTSTTYVQGNQDGCSVYYQHETGLNQVLSGQTTAIAANIKSGDFDIGQREGLQGDGDTMMRVSRVLPDFSIANRKRKNTIRFKRFSKRHCSKFITWSVHC